jgi:hypothetical protein
VEPCEKWQWKKNDSGRPPFQSLGKKPQNMILFIFWSFFKLVMFVLICHLISLSMDIGRPPQAACGSTVSQSLACVYLKPSNSPICAGGRGHWVGGIAKGMCVENTSTEALRPCYMTCCPTGFHLQLVFQSCPSGLNNRNSLYHNSGGWKSDVRCW